MFIVLNASYVRAEALEEPFGHRRLRGFARSRRRCGNGCGRCGAADYAERCGASLQDGSTFQGLVFHYLPLL
jgi:hypothetical protein